MPKGSGTSVSPKILGVAALEGRPQMNGPSDASARPRRFDVRSLLLWFQRNTIVALILLLLLFIAIVELMKPGTVNPVRLSNTLLFAAPLGILAAGQTMVMLTGGVDLSVVSVAGIPDDDDGGEREL
jgi:predicted ABC-type sugar transport system permease subunit